MFKLNHALALFMVMWLSGISVQAQSGQTAMGEPASSRAGGGVSSNAARMVKFSGALRDSTGAPLTGVTGTVGVALAIYNVQQGGTPLWMETQNISLDEQGNYSVLLGATLSDGLPLELFSTGDARWLGVQAQLPGEAEQPRVLLVGVPYALKAADAETLGGKPLSAFVLAGPDATGTQAESTVDSGKNIVSHVAAAVGATKGQEAVKTTGGTLNKLPKWDATGIVLLDSAVFENGGQVGVGTVTPGFKLDVQGGQINASGGLCIAGTCQSNWNSFGGPATFSAAPSGTGVGQGPLYVNPASASAGQTLLGVAVGGTQEFKVDSGGSVTAAGNINLPNTTVSLGVATGGVIALGGNRFLSNFGTNNTFVGQNSGNFTTSGGGANTAIGGSALENILSGALNTAVGNEALGLNTNGNNNTALGYASLQINSTGSNNTALGYQTGVTATSANANMTGSNNTFLGYNSGPGTSTQYTNATAIGANAVVSVNNALVLGSINTVNGATASVNVGIGTATPGYTLDVQGGQINSSGGYCMNGDCKASWAAVASGLQGSGTVTNVATGTGLTGGPITATGTVSVANGGIGTTQLADNSVTSAKIIDGTIVDADINATAAIAATKISGTAATLGANSFTSTQTITSGNLALPTTNGSGTAGVITLGGSRFLHNYGANNTFVGQGAGNFSMTGGGQNTATGFAALQNNTGGASNTVSGYDAMVTNTTGSGNTASGVQALQFNTSGGNNAATGMLAMQSNTSGYNDTATGYQSLLSNTTGILNTATGWNSMALNTTGIQNTASGAGALESNDTGSSNTAMGSSALFSNNGDINTAMGESALFSNSTGTNNSSIGAYSLDNNSTGNDNAAIGGSALFANDTGSSNTASGAYALNLNVNGAGNAALGYQAGVTTNTLNANVSGSNNTFVGINSGPGSATQLTNATAIGANAVVSANNALVLGSITGVNGATSSVNVGIGTATPAAALDVNSSAMILENAATPASSSAACTKGTIQWDTSYVYVCVAANTWKRSALSSF